MAKEITLPQFISIYESGDMQILDVREVWEKPMIRGANVINIPMNQLPNSIGMIPRSDDLIVICQHAVRSKRVIDYLESQHGFSNLINLQGGVSTYVAETA